MITCTFFLCLPLDWREGKKELSESAWEERLFWVSKWALGRLTSQTPSLCAADGLRRVLLSGLWEKAQSSPNWTQQSIDQGAREAAGGKDSGGWAPKRTDGWMRLKERIVRAEQTGHKKVTAAKDGNGRSRKEGGRVDGEERTGGGSREGQIRVKKGLLTLAVSQAICVAMLHVLLKGWSAGDTDIMVSTGKQGQARHT